MYRCEGGRNIRFIDQLTMSGVRVAIFSKYFAAGVTVGALLCSRHCSWMLATHHADIQQHYGNIMRYAEQVTSLEEMLGIHEKTTGDARNG